MATVRHAWKRVEDTFRDTPIVPMIPGNLRAARKRWRMTRGEVAERIGVSEHVYWKYEKARM